jgi:F-type H+-transporting ATPase subunit b
MFADPKFWVAASFVIFVLLFGKMGWAKITEMLDARGARIQDELDEAKRLRAEAEAMMRQAEAERAAAIAEAAQMLERAKLEAERVAAAASAEAEAAAKRRERMAMDRIAAAEASAVTEVRHAAAEIATAAVRDIVASHHDAGADGKMVDSAISALPQAFRAA